MSPEKTVSNKRVLPLDRLRNQKTPPAGLGGCGSCNKCLSATAHHLLYSAAAFTHLKSNPRTCCLTFHSSPDKPLKGREIKYKLLKEPSVTEHYYSEFKRSAISREPWEAHGRYDAYSGEKTQNSVNPNRMGSSVTSKHNCYGNDIVRTQLQGVQPQPCSAAAAHG